MKKVAIVQSNYIPWKGYFDLIAAVDEFILLDSLQFTRRDWRNRNLIKTPQGLQWLTIPVQVKGKFLQKISETRVSRPDWGRKHWATITQNYRRARWFHAYAERFEALYVGMEDWALSRVNHAFITAVCELLGIGTRISWDSDYPLVEGKTERLLRLCQEAGADCYLSGPSARSYLDAAVFERAGVRVQYMDYSGYPEYPQLYGAFDHGVTILDLVFNTGEDAPRYMKNIR